jgi:hypothetical protein
LIGGRGPLVRQAVDCLLEQTDVKAIVRAPGRGRTSLLSVIRHYGWWYLFQRVAYHTESALCAPGRLNRRGLPWAIDWEEGDDGVDVGEALLAEGVEVVIVCGFPHKLKRLFFERFRWCVNVHASSLPAYRGPDPIAWGLLDNVRRFGLTIHSVSAGLDTGTVLIQREVARPLLPIGVIVERALAAQLPAAMAELIAGIRMNQLSSREQGRGFYRPQPTLAHRLRLQGKSD